MLARWSRAVTQLHRAGSQNNNEFRKAMFATCRSYSDVSAAVAPSPTDSTEGTVESIPPVNLNKMFWAKPCSLALPPNSPLRIEEPKHEGIRHFILKMMLYYSKQSKAIRGTNAVYSRILSQVDRPAIYDVFNLEKTFKTTFSLLVLHMWMSLRRLKEEGKEGKEIGQYLYEQYNHDVEMRVSKAGVNLLLVKWVKELEKIFYGNVVAYDVAMLPEAKPDELTNVIWRNVFADDGVSKPTDAASQYVQALSRYVRRESMCLSLTDKEAMFSGNFMFTSLENPPSEIKR